MPYCSTSYCMNMRGQYEMTYKWNVTFRLSGIVIWTLNPESCHDANFVVTGGLRFPQWWQSCHLDSPCGFLWNRDKVRQIGFIAFKLTFYLNLLSDYRAHNKKHNHRDTFSLPELLLVCEPSAYPCVHSGVFVAFLYWDILEFNTCHTK